MLQIHLMLKLLTLLRKIVVYHIHATLLIWATIKQFSGINSL